MWHKYGIKMKWGLRGDYDTTIQVGSVVQQSDRVIVIPETMRWSQARGSGMLLW